MPTYEYECKSCAHTFEVFQSMNDEPVKNCPQCGKDVRRLIFGGSGIIFKGSGFYVTDKNKGSKSGSVKSSASAGSTGGDSKSSQSPAASSSAESSGKTGASSSGEKSSGEGKKSPSPAS